MRDSQRKRVYDAELAVKKSAGQHMPGLDFRGVTGAVAALQTRADQIATCPTIVAEFGPLKATITDGRGRRRGAACYDSGRIALPRPARQEWYLLHEMAHLYTGAPNPLHDVAAHGPEFAACYLRLYEIAIGPAAAAALRIEFGEKGVKIAPAVPISKTTEATA